MSITPWHSAVDFDLAERRNLGKEQIIDKYGKLLPITGEFAGMKIPEAREKIVAKLQAKGLVEKIEDYTHNIATAERTGATIEPQIMHQWFMNVNKKFTLKHSEIDGFKDGDSVTLKELMLHIVESGQTKILPDHFEKVYYNWVRNLHDWCLSRQIWYGHRIPVWYDKDGGVHLPKERKVVFLRHGESEANAAKVYDSQGKATLTEKGREQASLAGEQLKKHNFTRIFSSDMIRAEETAKIVCDKLGLKDFTFHKEFREVFGGDLEGKPRNDHPLLLAMLEQNTGETFDELVARAKKAWDLILADKSDGDVLVVGHQSFLCVMRAVMNGISTPEKLYAYRKKWKMGNATTRKYILSIDPTGDELTQDEDTLDTWFSSGLWTFSTLGWPNTGSPDFQKYHPTTILETGYDILPLWVSRMILMSAYNTGQIPFKTAYLHGLVRDEKGRKMSKSLGNIIDPLTLIDKYGTDALRMAMIVGVGPGSDSNLGEEKIKAYTKFANKFWNIARFVMENTSRFDQNSGATLDEEDKQTFEELNNLVIEITREMGEYKYYLVAEKLYHFIWHTFADIIIERSKKKIAEGRNPDSARLLLSQSLPIMLKVLHPFMPYITEEIWGLLPKEKTTLLMVEKWPCKT